MAKERRAIEDESIQRDVSREGLKVPDRHAVDLSTTVNAYQNRANALLSPRVLTNLLGTVDSVLDARRDDWLTNVKMNTDDWLTEKNIELAKVELTEQLNQDTEISKKTREMNAEYFDFYNQARRQNIPNMKEEMEKKVIEFEDQINNDQNASWYMTNKLLAKNTELGNQYITKAIDSDYELAENKALYERKNNRNFIAALIDPTGTQGGMALHEAMNAFEVQLLPNYKIKDINDLTTFRDDYNFIFKTWVDRLVNEVSLGNITPQDALDRLDTEFGAYAFRRYEVTDPKTGEKIQADVTLDPSVRDDAVTSILKKKVDTSYSESLRVVEDYKKANKVEDITKEGGTSILQTDVHSSTTKENAVKSFEENRRALVIEREKGNKQADKDLYKLAFEYISGVLPAASLSDMIRITLDQNGYNVPIVLNELESMRDQIGDYINNPAGKEFPNISITDETGRVVVSLMPSPDDVAMQDVKNMPGWGAQSTNVAIATRIYNMINNTIDDIRKDPGAALNIYSSVNKAKQDVESALNINKLIIVTGTDMPYVSPDGYNNAKKAIAAYQLELKSKANGNPALLNTVSTFDIKMYSDGLKGKSVAEQALYIQTLAQINNEVGDTDHYTRNSDFDNLSKDEQNFAKNYSMYGYIMQDNAVANKYNRKINNYLASGATITLNEIQRSAGLESIDDQLQEMFTKYHIPAEYHQGLTHTAHTMAAATLYEGKDNKFDIKDFEAVIKANFHKNGIYKFGAGVRGISMESLEETMTKYEKAAANGFKALGVEGTYKAKINPRTGKVYLEDQQGNYLTLHGIGGTIPGLPVKEVSFITRPPEGISEHNFNTGMSVLHTAVILTTGMMSVDSNLQAQKYFEGKGFTTWDNERIQIEGMKLMSFIADEKSQEEWLRFIESGYANQKLNVSAPPEVREALVKSLNGAFHNGQATREQQRMLYKFVDFAYSYGAIDLSQGNASGTGKQAEGNASGAGEQAKKDSQTTKSPHMKYGQMVTSISTNGENSSRGLQEANNVERVINKAGFGWKMTSKPGQEYDKNGNPIHAENGSHPKFKAMDVGFDGGFYRGCDARGVLKIESADALLQAFEEEGYMSNIDFIYYSKPDMLHDSEIARLKKNGTLPKNWEREPGYEKYGKMTNSEGKPLFRYARNHSDHLHIEFNKAMWDKQGEPLPREFAEMASSTIQYNLNLDKRLGYTTKKDAQFYAEAGKSYEPTSFTEEVTGVKAKVITSSPILQAQAFGTEYRTYENVLGSKDLADYAMAGYDFKLAYVVDYNHVDVNSNPFEDSLVTKALMAIGGPTLVGILGPIYNNSVLGIMGRANDEAIEGFANSRVKLKGAAANTAGTLIGAPVEGIGRALSAPADKVRKTVQEGKTEDGNLQKSETLTEGLPVVGKYQDPLYGMTDDGDGNYHYVGSREVEEKSFTAQDIVRRNLLARINSVTDTDGTWVVIVDEKSETPEKRAKLQEIRRIRKSW